MGSDRNYTAMHTHVLEEAGFGFSWRFVEFQLKMRFWNIHATMHGISALSAIRFIDIKLVMMAWVHVRECGSPRGSTCALTETICLPSKVKRHPAGDVPGHSLTHSLTHTCDGLFICQLYSLPDLLEETDCKEDTPLALPFAWFISLSQLIIVIWIKTSVGITTVFHTGISRAVAAA
jgi:hypothetical protein